MDTQLNKGEALDGLRELLVVRQQGDAPQEAGRGAEERGRAA